MSSKESIKLEVLRNKGIRDARTGELLPVDPSLFDTHRLKPKAQGGNYALHNTDLLCPVTHMKEHSNYRERDEQMAELKQLMDDRRQILKLQTKINNQIHACQRGTDTARHETLDFLGEQLKGVNKKLGQMDRAVDKQVRKMDEPLAKAALPLHGVGSLTIAACLVYIDIPKARHASSLWKYAGLDAPSHERYQKGVASGGNKNLRTALYTMAESQVKQYGPYREVYDNTQHRLAHSEKIVKTRNRQGFLVELPWKDTMASHRDGAAKRAIMKHFLADYWYVGRTLMGLETTPIYAEAILGMSHKTIKPEERGWIY